MTLCFGINRRCAGPRGEVEIDDQFFGINRVMWCEVEMNFNDFKLQLHPLCFFTHHRAPPLNNIKYDNWYSGVGFSIRVIGWGKRWAERPSFDSVLDAATYYPFFCNGSWSSCYSDKPWNNRQTLFCRQEIKLILRDTFRPPTLPSCLLESMKSRRRLNIFLYAPY